MMSLPLCRASSKMSIMPNGATQRSDTKVLLSLKRNTPGRSPFERRHVCPSQRVHSTLANLAQSWLDRTIREIPYAQGKLTQQRRTRSAVGGSDCLRNSAPQLGECQ